jgi:hypothetical protein
MIDDELRHLRRCMELATEALEAGDEPPDLAEAVHDLIRRFHGRS